ncbi:MAG: DUF4290 domain-containing protein [Bacteroidetes bacterium]|nr:MAG: DUF4290 domain-containing protein [Bacteroidota bacterium]
MTYNSAKEPLIIPEYGRHVQQLVEYAKTIEDPVLRQRTAERIIVLMTQMVPQNRNIDDYEAKLWRHLFRIARNELDVKPPEGVVIPEDLDKPLKPDRVPYPTQEARFRHYGHNVQTLIKRALAMEEGPKRDGFIASIAAYMKLAYKTWNREHYVSDEVIKTDLAALSGGKIVLPEEQNLENLVSNTKNRNRENNSNRRGGSKRNYSSSRSSGGGSRRRRKR